MVSVYTWHELKFTQSIFSMHVIDLIVNNSSVHVSFDIIIQIQVCLHPINNWRTEPRSFIFCIFITYCILTMMYMAVWKKDNATDFEEFYI